jgi:hypothetical protein
LEQQTGGEKGKGSGSWWGVGSAGQKDGGWEMEKELGSAAVSGGWRDLERAQ